MAKSSVRKVGVTPEFDPTLLANGALVLTWVLGKPTVIEKTVGEFTYRKTLTWSGADLIAVSEWVKV